MLIRFLSYLASVIGARRYKPLLISCLAVVVSVASISILISSASNGSSDAASTVQQEDGKNEGSQQSSSPALNGFEQKPTKDQGTPAGSQQQGASGTTPDAQQQADSQKTAAFDITLNTDTISLSQNSPDAAVTVVASDDGKLVWSITPDSAGNGLNARIEPSKDNDGHAVIRFRADTFTPGTYQFTVAAKTAGGQTASKTISVTVH